MKATLEEEKPNTRFEHDSLRSRFSHDVGRRKDIETESKGGVAGEVVQSSRSVAP